MFTGILLRTPPRIANGPEDQDRRLLGPVRLQRSKDHPDGPERRGARRLWRVCVNLSRPYDFEFLEAGRFDDRSELCFQQSARDSPRPEVDALLGLLAYGFLNEDIGDL